MTTAPASARAANDKLTMALIDTASNGHKVFGVRAGRDYTRRPGQARPG
jgi:hypothetical protein